MSASNKDLKNVQQLKKTCNKSFKKPLDLKGSSINLVERDKGVRRTQSRPASALSKTRNVLFRRPASADFTLSGPDRFADGPCRKSSSLCVSPRKPDSALAVCRKAGFCGTEAAYEAGQRQQLFHRTHCPGAGDDSSLLDGTECLDPELMKYAYTADSAKLLESLLREPWRSDESNPSSTRSKAEFAKKHTDSCNETLRKRSEPKCQQNLHASHSMHNLCGYLQQGRNTASSFGARSLEGTTSHFTELLQGDLGIRKVSINLTSKHGCCNDHSVPSQSFEKKTEVSHHLPNCQKYEERSMHFRNQLCDNNVVDACRSEYMDRNKASGVSRFSNTFRLDNCQQTATAANNSICQKHLRHPTSVHARPDCFDDFEAAVKLQVPPPSPEMSLEHSGGGGDASQEIPGKPQFDVKNDTLDIGKKYVTSTGLSKKIRVTDDLENHSFERPDSLRTGISENKECTTRHEDCDSQMKNRYYRSEASKLRNSAKNFSVFNYINEGGEIEKNENVADYPEKINCTRSNFPCIDALNGHSIPLESFRIKTRLKIDIRDENEKIVFHEKFSPEQEVQIQEVLDTRNGITNSENNIMKRNPELSDLNEDATNRHGLSEKGTGSTDRQSEKNMSIFECTTTRDDMKFSDNFSLDNLDEINSETTFRDETNRKPVSSKDSIKTTTDSEKESDLIFHKWVHKMDSTVVKSNQIEECVLIDLTTEERSDKSSVIPSDKIENDSGVAGVTPRDSTLADIENIIQVLENEGIERTESEIAVQTLENPAKGVTDPGVENTDNKKVNEIFEYLDQVERCSEIKQLTARSPAVVAPIVVGDSSIPRMEELLCRSSVDLAQEVLSLRLQAEEQSGGIRLLQQTIAELKESHNAERLAHQTELTRVAAESDVALLKHQKMVNKLLGEKKSLNDKLSEVINEMKSSEERHQRNMKIQQERHLVELQRIKETQAAAEKLKREKWIDVKTQKIKEMTVKGLEPELSRMAARQQQELQELRALHRQELETVELKAARRTSDLMDQLRSELAKDKEEALQREENTQRLKWEKRMEDEARMHEEEVKRLKDDLRRERSRLSALEAHVQEKLMEARLSAENDRERDRKEMLREWQEKLDQIKVQHQTELKNLKEALEMEKDVWMENFKKLQKNKYLEKEADLRHHFKCERDREIELAIEKLETEATKERSELVEASENKLRRLREKLEDEVNDLKTEISSMKTKLLDARAQLADKEDMVADLQGQLRRAQTEFSQLKKLCDEMSAERADLRRVLQADVDKQMKEAEAALEAARREMCELIAQHAVELSQRSQTEKQIRQDAEKELQHVYNRVKVTIKKKDDELQVQKEQYRVVLERCSHLESMLENQRKNLLLK